MVLMPAVWAFFRQAEPESESRLTIRRTFTPSLIMLSHSVPNLALSPPAFWMSDWMPAESNAAFSSGRSLASQRGELAESGRITPTFLLEPPLAEPPAPPELELEQAASRNAAADTVARAASERLRIDPILSWRLSRG